MKRYFCLFGSFFLIIFLAFSAYAQDDAPHGQWSFAAFSGINISISSAMHGTIEDYHSAIENGTTATQYPFGGNHTHSIPVQGQIAYRYAKSPMSIYLAASASSFNTGFGFRYSPSGRYTMTIGTTTAGLEYTLGQLYQHWNFFGRLGLNSSLIVGNYRIRNQDRFMDVALSNNGTRYGIEMEIGERYNISRSPIGIEASLNYTNVNLIGKSYTDPALNQGLFSRGSGDINDGKNPNDPNDNARVIDYLSLRVGARIYF